MSKQGRPFDPEPDYDSFAAPQTVLLDDTSPVSYAQVNSSHPAALEWQCRKLKARIKFYKHFVPYLAVNIALICIWLILQPWFLWMRPAEPWFLWFSLPWGVALCIHYYHAIVQYNTLEAHVVDPEIRLQILGK